MIVFPLLYPEVFDKFKVGPCIPCLYPLPLPLPPSVSPSALTAIYSWTRHGACSSTDHPVCLVTVYHALSCFGCFSIMPCLAIDPFVSSRLIMTCLTCHSLTPGTGKTLCARALANECSKAGRHVSFFMRKGSGC